MMSDLWIIYNASYDYGNNSATRMLDEAIRQGINASLMFSDYFSFNKDGIFYKEEIIKEYPRVIFYRGRDENLIIPFEKKGIKVINSSETTVNCKDKYKTHQIANNLNINQPKTFLLENKSYDHYFNIFKDHFLLKNRYGAQGKDIYLIENEKDYNKAIKLIEIDDYIVQEFINVSSGKDVRAYVIGNKIVGAMERINENSYLANVAQGGLSYSYTLDEDAKRTTLLLSSTLKGDIISVDYLISDKGLIFCEANTNAGFASFIYLGYNMRQLMMEYIKELLGHN